ncbi:MAG: ATP-binding cassette domain-containing protein [Candidatus Binatia bacterium]
MSFTLEPGQSSASSDAPAPGKLAGPARARLFDVGSGAVLLDGRDVRRLPLAALRQAIGMVPRDPLFSTTILDNIAFGLDAVEPGVVERAAAVAGVADDIEAFPHGYDTVVGERGITLSGGQKQRLTLARAIAATPRVLVLDDALSSVDTRTEHAILAHLREAAAGCTRIVIAHRVSTVMDADQIAVVDDGRVVELGTHATLPARDGLYAELFRQQQLEEEIEAL